jgi:hypothetical protein
MTGSAQRGPAPSRPGRWPTGGRTRRRTRVACAALATLAVTGASAAAAAWPATAATDAQHPAAAAWRIAFQADGKGSPFFSTVTAVTRNNVWAFEAGESGTIKPTAWHKAGRSWLQVPFPGRKGEIVGSAAETAAGNVWAFTGNLPGSKARALRWNGSTWASVGSFKGAISGAAVIGSADAWVFGAPNSVRPHFSARHWNGHRWAIVPSGHGLTDGSALSASSVWAVGGEQVAHWNGHTWTRTSVASLLPKNTQLSHSELTGIYAQSAFSVWAIASGGREDEGGPTVLLHYNGIIWSKVTSRLSSDPVQVVPDGSGGLWIPVPGTDGQASQLLHYSGGHLSAVALPGGGGARLHVNAVAHVPGTGISYGTGFTHKKNNLGVGLHAVVLVSG